MEGGCFTVSNLGGISGNFFTPIINPPEVAILGISPITIKPLWKNGGFVPRQVLPITLSYDHRVIDGVAGQLLLNTLDRYYQILGQLFYKNKFLKINSIQSSPFCQIRYTKHSFNL